MAKKILIIEDETDLVEMVKVRLEANSYSVLTAYDGLEGLEKAREEKPDLIILDLMLPKIDGYEICSSLKRDAEYRKIPIIIFTARAQEYNEKLGYEAGADDYVSKPFDAHVLLSKIQKLLKE